MRKAGTANTTHKSSTDMENHVYVKAKSRVSPAHRPSPWLLMMLLFGDMLENSYKPLMAHSATCCVEV